MMAMAQESKKYTVATTAYPPLAFISYQGRQIQQHQYNAIKVRIPKRLKQRKRIDILPNTVHATTPSNDMTMKTMPPSLQSKKEDKVSQSNPSKDYGKAAPIPPPNSKALLCGDGDLSYSASIAEIYAQQNISLVATVLEDQDVHHSVYANSRENTNHISFFPTHQVLFGVNVTNLNSYFSDHDGNNVESDHSGNLNGENQYKMLSEINKANIAMPTSDLSRISSSLSSRSKFDLIQFNFPHWRGKQNHKYNRELLNSFLCNASKLLTQNGKIYIALCEGQGGSSAQTKREWRDSWKAAEYAALHGLLLVDVFPFKVSYNLSSHRGMDRSFKIGKNPKMYIFAKSNANTNDKNGEKQRNTSIIKAPQPLQLCCRHEIHVALPIQPINNLHDKNTKASFLSADEVRDMIQNVMPSGIRVEVPIFRVVDEDIENDALSKMTVGIYLVIYCGEHKPMKRVEAENELRSSSEQELFNHFLPRPGSNLNNKKWLVSKPFPYPLLDGFLKGHRLIR